jgi:hypothetical protein
VRVPSHFKRSLPLARYLDDNIKGAVLRHVACMGEKKNVCGFSKKTLRGKRTWEV